MATLRNVLDNIASYINQDPTLVTGTDLTSQINLVNQSQLEWANTYHWKLLRQTYFVPTVGVSATSIGLPSYFQKTMSALADYNTSPPTTYQQLYNPAERFYHNSTDKYFYVMGDDGTGHYMVTNNILANASLQIDIQVQPTALATITDVVTCPSYQFLALRAISKILSARSDPRFPQIKSDSDDIMASLIEEDVASSGGVINGTPDRFSKAGFRIGL